MPDSVAVLPGALDILEQRLGEDDPAAVMQVLRALQRLGLSRQDLQVHLERMRAVNETVGRSTLFERHCLLALDVVLGYAGNASLRWDAAQMARLLLPRVLAVNTLEGAVEPALSRSDMLPPRMLKVPVDELRQELLHEFSLRLEQRQVEPRKADFFRVPKSGFTSRPAALLAPQDRIAWEALAELILPSLRAAAPAELVWPRGRELVEFDVFSRTPLTWPAPYVVRTDVESFYDSVDHAVLAIGLATSLRLRSTFTQAVEAFLDAVMGSSQGLPQGPPASEVFATCYLLPIDGALRAAGVRFARYADDYVFEADSLLKGRRTLELLEEELRAVGLRLNSAKTRILKASTYRDNVGAAVSPRVVAKQNRLGELAEARLRNSDDMDAVDEELRELGVEEELIWDLLYHRSITLDEVIDGLRDRLDPTLTDSYAEFLREEAGKLRNGDYPTDVRSSQADLEESLLYLASARRWVDQAALMVPLTWHPTLAPAASAYLRNVAKRHLEDTRPAVLEWLAEAGNTDWVQAWGCAAAEGEPTLVDQALAGHLRLLATSSATGPLTRAGSARALAAADLLDPATWRDVLSASTPAMLSELYLDAQAAPAAYPHTVPSQQSALGPAELPGDEYESGLSQLPPP